MINASFVFGMDADDPDVFMRTVDWAVNQGIETVTFHILTPYPDTPLFRRMQSAGRITSLDWNQYDTRHAVFAPRRMSARELESGYRQAYREFYSWANILHSTVRQDGGIGMLRHFAYKTAWKKFEPFWDWIIRLKHVSSCTPLLEKVLSVRAQRGARNIGKPAGLAEGVVEELIGCAGETALNGRTRSVL
jgi:radical SAM superfamily enzyme YgiQ (UPF0313 family)